MVNIYDKYNADTIANIMKKIRFESPATLIDNYCSDQTKRYVLRLVFDNDTYKSDEVYNDEWLDKWNEERHNEWLEKQTKYIEARIDDILNKKYIHLSGKEYGLTYDKPTGEHMEFIESQDFFRQYREFLQGVSAENVEELNYKKYKILELNPDVKHKFNTSHDVIKEMLSELFENAKDVTNVKAHKNVATMLSCITQIIKGG